MTMAAAAKGKLREFCSVACGGYVDQYFTEMNVGTDALPTRTIKGSKNAPALTGINPGHTPLNSSHLKLTKDQIKRLNI